MANEKRIDMNGADAEKALGELVARGWVVRDGGGYVLTDAGAKYVRVEKNIIIYIVEEGGGWGWVLAIFIIVACITWWFLSQQSKLWSSELWFF